MQKILIIDDFPESCREITAHFQTLYKVKTLSDFSIKEVPIDFDFYLIDIHLPSITGDRIIKYLREQGNTQAVYALMTAEPLTESIQRYYAEYVDDFFYKVSSTPE